MGAARDDQLVNRQPFQNHLQIADLVARHDHALLDDVVRADDIDIKILPFVHDGRRRNRQLRRVELLREIDLHETAGHDRVVGVRAEQLDHDRVRRGIDLVVEEIDFDSARQLLSRRVAHDHRMVHKLAVLVVTVEIRFGHGETDLDRIVLHDRRQLAGGRADFVADGHDQFADAPRDRRVDFRVGKIVFAKLYGRFHLRDLRLQRRTVLLIYGELRVRNDFFVDQSLVAVVLFHGVVVFRFDLLQAGFRGLQFRLVDRVFDFKQQIAFQDDRAFAEGRLPQRAVHFRRDVHRLGRPHASDVASRLGLHHGRAPTSHDHGRRTLHLGLRRQCEHADRNHH